MLQFDLSKARKFVSEEEMENFETQTLAARDTLLSGKGAGNDFLGLGDTKKRYRLGISLKESSLPTLALSKSGKGRRSHLPLSLSISSLLCN